MTLVPVIQGSAAVVTIAIRRSESEILPNFSLAWDDEVGGKEEEEEDDDDDDDDEKGDLNPNPNQRPLGQGGRATDKGPMVMRPADLGLGLRERERRG